MAMTTRLTAAALCFLAVALFVILQETRTRPPGGSARPPTLTIRYHEPFLLQTIAYANLHEVRRIFRSQRGK